MRSATSRRVLLLIVLLLAAVVVVPTFWRRRREGMEIGMDEDEADAADEASKKTIRSYLSDVYPTDEEKAERKRCEEKLTTGMHLKMMRGLHDPAATIRYVSVQTANACLRDPSPE